MNFSYWFKNWSFTYKIGYAIVRLGNKTFYKNFEVSGFENIPASAGVLFAINHQNAFMDPVVLSSQLNQNAYYLARADIFKKKFANKILRSIYMLPIYRQRDGVNTIEKNEATFNECFDILNDKGCILIFPEGNHNNQKKLRGLKKGIARIGLGAAKKYNYKNPYFIVPVGLDYSNHTKMGADLLINIGEPINLNDYYSNFQNDSGVAINKVMSNLRNKMEKLMVNIQSESYLTYTQVISLFKQEINKNSSLKDRLIAQQRLVLKLESIENNQPELFNNITSESSEIFNYLALNNLSAVNLLKDLSPLKLTLNFFVLITFLPLHLLGLISNYLPYKLPVLFVNKKVKDEHFHSSIKMSLGVILFLIFWSLQAAVVLIAFEGLIGLSYLMSLPILAILNYRWLILYKKTIGLCNAFKLNNTSDFKRNASKLKGLFDALKN